MTSPPPDPIAQARQLISTGQEASALDILRNIVGAGPQIGPRWQLVMQMCEQLGDEDASAEAARQFGALAPDDPQRALIYAEKLSRIGQSDSARQITQHLAETRPNDPAVAYFHGVHLSRAGQFEAAEEHLRRALSIKPDLADAWVQLSAFLNFSERPADIEAMRQLSRSSATAVQMPANYALGSALHDLGETEAAFAAWQTANDLLSAERPLSKESLRQYEGLAQRFSHGMDGLPESTAQATPAPIFIVGAPRTGTTLTEHVLSAHPDVHPLGESLISRVATWPLRHLSPDDIVAARRRYGDGLWSIIGDVYSALADQRARGAAHTTDKAAMLHVWVGALAAALPRAKFIWVQRTPEAAALSAFRTYFTSGNDWSCKLSDALAYYAAHNRLMSEWAPLLGERMLALEYESLARAPDEIIPQLLEFAGLSAVSQPLEPHKSSRSVDSASLAQVRRPINPASIDAWRKYEAFFPPATETQ